ncbi:hypothetical protein CsSME_00052996 [Camellia sinensis var. sinensis]
MYSYVKACLARVRFKPLGAVLNVLGDNKEASSAQVNGRSQGKQLITKGSPTFKRKKLYVEINMSRQT